MVDTLVIGIITGLVIAITALIEHFFFIFEILFKKPVKPKGAIEIDSKEHIYAHPDYPGKLQGSKSFDVHTIYDVLQRGLRLSENKPQFTYRYSSNEKFKSYTYKEVFQIITEIGSGVVNLGLKPSNETFLGIYASATMNYALCLYSTWPYSMVPVGIYDSLGREGVQFIIKHAAVQLIFADDLQRVRNLIEWKNDEVALKIIVSMVEPTEELIKLAEAKQLQLTTLEKVRESGRNNPVEHSPPTPSDMAMIMYTSGSTGEPKGCVITHENFIYGMYGIASTVNIFNTNESYRFLNFMPLAHLFGCGSLLCTTYLGGEIGFWQGKVEKLMDDFRDFQPTLVAMVPRLLNRLYDKVRLEFRKKGILGRMFFRLAVRSKLALIHRGNFSQDTIWDKILFEKIRQSFGGKVNRVVSSSAPLSTQVCGFTRAAFSCFFVEAYGQTECILGCSQTVNDIQSGETGIPTPHNHVKLVDVPEKEYFARDGVGEICIRSKAVFKGYLKDEEKTSETIDSDGWLHTGDIGRWTPHKTMKIVDRKKNMYKLSQGEYVAPEKIEDVYGRSRFIQQLFVYGDSFESSLVAIVVLDEEAVKKWAASQGVEAQTPSGEWNPKLKQVVLEDMSIEGKRRGLMSYEQVKGIEFIKEPFTIENGLLTPTLKARRFALEKKYKDVFQKIYETTKN